MDCQVVYSEVAKLADRGLQCRIVDYAGSGFCLTDVESGERIVHFTHDIIWLNQMMLQILEVYCGDERKDSCE